MALRRVCLRACSVQCVTAPTIRLAALEARGARVVEAWRSQPPRAARIVALVHDAGTIEHHVVRELAWALSLPHMARGLTATAAFDMARFAQDTDLGGEVVSGLCTHCLLPALAQRDAGGITPERVLDAFNLCLSSLPIGQVLPRRNPEQMGSALPALKHHNGSDPAVNAHDAEGVALELPGEVDDDLDELEDDAPEGDPGLGSELTPATPSGAVPPRDGQDTPENVDTGGSAARLDSLAKYLKFAPATSLAKFAELAPECALSKSIDCLDEINRRLLPCRLKPEPSCDFAASVEVRDRTELETLLGCVFHILEPLYASFTSRWRRRVICAIREANFQGIILALQHDLTGTAMSDNPDRHAQLLGALCVSADASTSLRACLAAQQCFAACSPNLPWLPLAWKHWVAATLCASDGTISVVFTKDLLAYGARHARSRRLDQTDVVALIRCASSVAWHASLNTPSSSTESSFQRAFTESLALRDRHVLLSSIRWVATKERRVAVLVDLLFALVGLRDIEEVASSARECLDQFTNRAMALTTPHESAAGHRALAGIGKWGSYTLLLRLRRTPFSSTDFDRALDLLVLRIGRGRSRPSRKLVLAAIDALSHRQLSFDAAAVMLTHHRCAAVTARSAPDVRIKVLALAYRYRVTCRGLVCAVLQSMPPIMHTLNIHELGLLAMAAHDYVYDDDTFRDALERAVLAWVERETIDGGIVDSIPTNQTTPLLVDGVGAPSA